MRRVSIVTVLILASAAADAQPREGELAHTYSIVARDSATGQLGVAVQTHWFAVGRRVPWASAGIGAVATQSYTNPSFGPRGLDLLRSGRTAQEALDLLIESDEGRDARQVAIVDSEGRVAAWTGEKCIPAAGHIVGDGYAVQANLMLSDEVWPAMARAYEGASGDLARRMLAALAAAQEAGGDIRGKQSAALLVVKPAPVDGVWQERIVDLRIDDDTNTIRELTRLLDVNDAYSLMSGGADALEEGDLDLALQRYAESARLYPENPELRFWQAVSLANHGHMDQALPVFERVFSEDPAWRTLAGRLPGVDRLTVSEADLERVLGLGIE